MSGAGSTCSSCGAPRQDETGPCPACGALSGEDHRCPRCQALAGLREVAPGRYTCMACGKPRKRLPGSHVGEPLADLLVKRASATRLISRLAYAAAGVFAVGGLGLASVLGLLSFGGAALTVAALAGAFSVGSYLFGRGRAREAEASARRALEGRLLSLAAGPEAGVTVPDAAAAVSRAQAEVDDALTALAKRGRLDMDVDDEGVIRYRVAEEDLLSEDDEETLAARRGGA